MVSSTQLYLLTITVCSLLCLPAPTFGYAIVTSEALWGNIFSFAASINHAVIVNVAFLGIHSLMMDVEASWLLNVHVVLFAGTYLLCLLMNFLLWEGQKLMWSTMIPVFVTARNGSSTAVATMVTFDPPDELVTLVAAPTVLFNFVVLPFALFMRRSTCGKCITIESEPAA